MNPPTLATAAPRPRDTTLTDHRARSVPLCTDPEVLALAHIVPGRDPSGSWRAGLNRRLSGFEILLYSSSAGLFLAVMVVLNFATPNVPKWALTLGIGVLFGLLFPLAFRRYAFRQFRDQISSGLLAIGRCPSCGYDLIAIPPDPADRCRVCPECGAAWRLDHARREAS